MTILLCFTDRRWFASNCGVGRVPVGVGKFEEIVHGDVVARWSARRRRLIFSDLYGFVRLFLVPISSPNEIGTSTDAEEDNDYRIKCELKPSSKYTIKDRKIEWKTWKG
jgi:hypothetical protein